MLFTLERTFQKPTQDRVNTPQLSWCDSVVAVAAGCQQICLRGLSDHLILRPTGGKVSVFTRERPAAALITFITTFLLPQPHESFSGIRGNEPPTQLI